jgi:hypothetical protein
MGPVSWPFCTADSRRTAGRIAVLNLILALFLAVASLAFLSVDFNGTKPERLKKFVRNRAEFGRDWNKAKEWLNLRFTIYDLRGYRRKKFGPLINRSFSHGVNEN